MDAQEAKNLQAKVARSPFVVEGTWAQQRAQVEWLLQREQPQVRQAATAGQVEFQITCKPHSEWLK